MLIGIGVPPQLAVYSLLCLANLPAGLTHYGTTTAPILFGLGLCLARRLVEGRLLRLGRQHGGLADDRIRVVESGGLLVNRR